MYHKSLIKIKGKAWLLCLVIHVSAAFVLMIIGGQKERTLPMDDLPFRARDSRPQNAAQDVTRSAVQETRSQLTDYLLGCRVLASEERRNSDGTWVRRTLLETGLKYSRIVREQIYPDGLGSAPSPTESVYAAGHVLIRTHPVLGEDGLKRLQKTVPGSHWQPTGTRGLYRFFFPEASLQSLEKYSAILDLEPGCFHQVEAEQLGQVSGAVIPNDKSFAYQYYHSSQNSEDINTVEAWSVTTGNRSVKVAVIDTGVELNNKDLVLNLWKNPGEGVRADFRDNEGNGFPDDLFGWDFYGNDSTPSDENWHGTFMASLIGAQGNNGLGISGVNWAVTLIPIRAFGPEGLGFVGDVVAAMDYALEQGAQIICAAWTFSGESNELKAAVERARSAQVAVVAATGNEGLDLDLHPRYPACFVLSNVLPVATGGYNGWARGSNYASGRVEILTPYYEIAGLFPTIATPFMKKANIRTNKGLGFAQGSSTSAALVAGALAIIRSADLGLTGLDCLDYLREYQRTKRERPWFLDVGGAVRRDNNPPPLLFGLVGVTPRDDADWWENYFKGDGRVGVGDFVDLRIKFRALNEVTVSEMSRVKAEIEVVGDNVVALDQFGRTFVSGTELEAVFLLMIPDEAVPDLPVTLNLRLTLPGTGFEVIKNISFPLQEPAYPARTYIQYSRLVAISPVGDLVCIMVGNKIYVQSLLTGKHLGTMEYPDNTTETPDWEFSADGKRFFVADQNMFGTEVIEYSLETFSETKRYAMGRLLTNDIIVDHAGILYGLGFELPYDLYESTLIRWDTVSGQKKEPLYVEGKKMAFSRMVADRDRKKILLFRTSSFHAGSASADGLIDVAAGGVFSALSRPLPSSTGLGSCFSSAQNLLVWKTNNPGLFKIYKLNSGETIETSAPAEGRGTQPHGTGVGRIHETTDGRFLCALGYDGAGGRFFLLNPQTLVFEPLSPDLLGQQTNITDFGLTTDDRLILTSNASSGSFVQFLNGPKLLLPYSVRGKVSLHQPLVEIGMLNESIFRWGTTRRLVGRLIWPHVPEDQISALWSAPGASSSVVFSDRNKMVTDVTFGPGANNCQLRLEVDVDGKKGTYDVPMYLQTGPLVSIECLTPVVKESEGKARFRLRKTGSSGPARAYIDWAGTAIYGLDFTYAKSAFVLEQDVNELDFEVPILLDRLQEGREWMTLRLMKQSNHSDFTDPVSATVVITDDSESAPPVVRPRPLAAKGRITSLPISVSGTATDSGGVARVEFSVNGGPWQRAYGTTSWQFNVSELTVGVGKISVRACDRIGNYSQPVQLPFTYQP